MGKNFALYGVGKGVGIGAFDELRSGRQREHPSVAGLLRPLKQAVHQPPRRQGSGNQRPLKQTDLQTPIAVLDQVLPLSLFLERRSVPLLVVVSQFLPARGYCGFW